MSKPFRVDVPSENQSVFSNDGRVFVSLDSIIEAMEPGVERRTFAANLIKDPVAIAHTDAENMVLDWLKSQREILSLENNFSD